MPEATKPDNRLDLRIAPGLKAKVKAEATDRGQSLTVFVVRALEAALSEAKGVTRPTQVGPVPVPSQEGVRPVAPPRAPSSDQPDLMVALKASLDAAATNGAAPYGCPTRDCDFAALSPAAVCGRHGKKVKGKR